MAEAEEALIPKLAEEPRREPKIREPRRLTEIISAQLDALRVYHRAVLDSDEVEAVHKIAEKVCQARLKGYEGDPCRECGQFTMVRNGTCLKCDTCGSTSGCS